MNAPGKLQSIRAKVVCLLVHDSRTLWIRARDEVKQEDFLIPPGGGVEFGERLIDAVRRELREELEIDVPEPSLLAFSENLFAFNGVQEHELVFVFAARCPSNELASASNIEVIESSGERLSAAWFSPDVLADGTHNVYPSGVLAHVPQALRLFGPNS